METILSAIVLFVLVVAGLYLVVNHTNWLGVAASGPRPSAHTGAEQLRSSLLKVATLILGLLGVAFLGGALLASLQGVAGQVAPFVACGVICLVAAVACRLFRGRTHVAA